MEEVKRVVCWYCETAAPSGASQAEAEWNAREQGFDQHPRGKWRCPECIADGEGEPPRVFH